MSRKVLQLPRRRAASNVGLACGPSGSRSAGMPAAIAVEHLPGVVARPLLDQRAVVGVGRQHDTSICRGSRVLGRRQQRQLRRPFVELDRRADPRRRPSPSRASSRCLPRSTGCLAVAAGPRRAGPAARSGPGTARSSRASRRSGPRRSTCRRREPRSSCVATALSSSAAGGDRQKPALAALVPLGRPARARTSPSGRRSSSSPACPSASSSRGCRRGARLRSRAIPGPMRFEESTTTCSQQEKRPRNTRITRKEEARQSSNAYMVVAPSVSNFPFVSSVYSVVLRVPSLLRRCVKQLAHHRFIRRPGHQADHDADDQRTKSPQTIGSKPSRL